LTGRCVPLELNLHRLQSPHSLPQKVNNLGLLLFEKLFALEPVREPALNEDLP
jgi:hypothetical protein